MRERISRKVATASIVVASAIVGCSKAPQPDAYGNVEATEVVVGAEAVGRLVTFDVNEGAQLAAAAVVGTIDSTDLALERDQATADRSAGASRVVEVSRQVDVLKAQQSAATSQRDAAQAQRAALVAQQDIARRAYDRTKRLFDQQAATSQQLDQAERDLRVLEQQVKAQDDQIAAHEHQIAAGRQQIDAAIAQQRTASDQVVSTDARVARLAERIRKSQVTNPTAGTVLATYARAGEFVQTGQPLYKIADLGSVEVRAYVVEPQLAHVRLGASANVSFDVAGGSRQSLPATVSWVSSRAEFTPTPIQTREERADLVYAIKLRVANASGQLKIGMPVDVTFAQQGSTP
ncbi:MAG TPA: HlyD family efflux transporter periplasmic adaptor subunit [Vicinamibacterales bacterium]|jgi:HlyD family secretion protein